MPFAAASIGQVHKATMLDGRQVAIKIQVLTFCFYITLLLKQINIILTVCKLSVKWIDI